MSVPLAIRIKIVLLMAKFESLTAVQRKLKVEFGDQTPSLHCIKDTFERFKETGTVEERQRSGRPPIINEEKAEEVLHFCETDPTSSVRTVAAACSIPKTTAHRIMTENLSLKPYKMHFVQQLYEEDLQDRIEMCNILKPMLSNKDNEENIFFSDEATFHLNGLVNKHNVRYWSESNPFIQIETVMRSPKVNVWCAMSCNRLIGPFFFEGDTVDGPKYLSMLQEFFIPEVRKLNKMRSLIFQQDGAPAHFAVDVRRFLDKTFPGRWTGRGGPIRWAPRSPDLTPLDFFLWGYVKANVYQSRYANLAELKGAIHQEIKAISKKTLPDVFSNILKRMDLCVSVDGDHFEHLL
jgi:hypothetical protein